MIELFIKKKEKKRRKRKKNEPDTWIVISNILLVSLVNIAMSILALNSEVNWTLSGMQLGVSTFPCKVSPTGQCRFWESTWNMGGGATSNKSTREMIMDFDDIHCAYGSLGVLWVL